MRILVTDGDSRAALAVVRSLGRRGHYVVVGEHRTPCLADASKYCAAGFTYPQPFDDGAAFVAAVRTEVTRRGIDVLLPVSDVTSSLIGSERSTFAPLCRVALADSRALARAADKVEVMRLAERLGVPIPRTVYVDSADQVTAVASAIRFPVVVKPRRSRVQTRTGWRSCSVRYAQTSSELERNARSLPCGAYPLILQEKVRGPGLGVFICRHEGRSVATFSHRRLREKPPSGGVSVLSESVSMRPDLLSYSEALLRDLDWTGVAMVEFKMDERDGVPKLMEINGRFWGSLQLAVDAGVDFPAILVDTVTGHAPLQAPDYQSGVRSRWFWGDFDSLLTTLFGDANAAGSPTVSAKLRRLSEFLKLWSGNLHYENPRWSDLGPWRYETRRWLRDRLASSPRRFRAPRRAGQ